MDHKPLLGILGDKSLEDIENPRLENLKEKTLRYKFTIVHVPGIKNKVADAASRFPTGIPEHYDLAALQAGGQSSERLTRELVRATRQEPNAIDIEDTIEVEKAVEAAIQSSISSISIGGSGGNCEAVTLEMVVNKSTKHPQIKQLAELIRNGIADNKQLWPDNILAYYKVRNELSEKDGVVSFKKRVVVPGELRT